MCWRSPIISSIPASQSDGRRAISGSSTFIDKDGVITATITAAARGYVNTDRNVNYNQVFATTGSVEWRDSSNTAHINSGSASNVINTARDRQKENWDSFFRDGRSNIVDIPAIIVNVYRNGGLVETYTEPVSRADLVNVVATTKTYFTAVQSIQIIFDLIELHKIVLIDVNKGDFIQIEIIAEADITYGYPSDQFTGGYIYEFGSRPSGCPSSGSPIPPWDCRSQDDYFSPEYVAIIRQFPDAVPIVNANETRQVEITGGYVIFAGN